MPSYTFLPGVWYNVNKDFQEITFSASGYSIGVNKTKYSEMGQVKFVEYNL